MNSIITFTPEQFRKAADIQDRIRSLQDELASVLGASGNKSIKWRTPPERRMSAAGRTAISAAAKAKWEKYRTNAGTKNGVRKRTMSTAAKARLSKIAKARWASAKKAGRNTL